jgi:hypothetical protein
MVVDPYRKRDTGNVFLHRFCDSLYSITHIKGARAWVESGLGRFHRLVEHDFVSLAMDSDGQIMRLSKSRQDSEGQGNAKFQEWSCMAEGHPYVVNNQGNTGLIGETVFRLFRGKGPRESIEPKETSHQKGGTFQQKVPSIHGHLL